VKIYTSKNWIPKVSPLFFWVKNSTKFVGEKDNLLSATTTRVGKKKT